MIPIDSRERLNAPNTLIDPPWVVSLIGRLQQAGQQQQHLGPRARKEIQIEKQPTSWLELEPNQSHNNYNTLPAARF